MYRTVDDGNWDAPVPLTRHQPVPEPVSDNRLARAVFFQPGRDFLDRLFGIRQPVKLPALD